jgi:diadenosine tetraphosphate (Ap4A) HIT family hydrolase
MSDSRRLEADAIPRRTIDATAYERCSREGPCFVCETLAGNPDYPGDLVWADDDAVAFLARYNTLLGHTLMSLGSQSGNRHVHWHVAPLPPGVPYEQQQFGAFSWDRGILALPDDEMAALAKRMGARVEAMQSTKP